MALGRRRRSATGCSLSSCELPFAYAELLKVVSTGAVAATGRVAGRAVFDVAAAGHAQLDGHRQAASHAPRAPQCGPRAPAGRARRAVGCALNRRGQSGSWTAPGAAMASSAVSSPSIASAHASTACSVSAARTRGATRCVEPVRCSSAAAWASAVKSALAIAWIWACLDARVSRLFERRLALESLRVRPRRRHDRFGKLVHALVVLLYREEHPAPVRRRRGSSTRTRGACP